jgi:AGCS family alanine or glycine:cation symporter
MVMQQFTALIQQINACLSDYVLVILLVGTGIFFTVRTRFVQVRCLGDGFRSMLGGFRKSGPASSGLSSFQALTTAIAAQVGTGNIVGACGAILIGGPGAIFWMWIIAFFGMATIYAEAVLAQETRVTTEGTVHGGPVYYIQRAFRGRFGRVLAGFFAVALILALGFMGCMVQSNSIGSTCQEAFGIPAWVIGLIVAALTGVIILGGVQRIAAVTEKIVPSGLKETRVPRFSELPTTCSGSVVTPRSKPMVCSLPSRQTRTFNQSERAFTQETPTPCRPPETL